MAPNGPAVPSHLVDKYQGSRIQGFRDQQQERPFYYGNDTENEVVRGGSRDGRCESIYSMLQKLTDLALCVTLIYIIINMLLNVLELHLRNLV